MIRFTRNSFAALLVLALAACSLDRPAAPAPGTGIPVPVVLASLTSSVTPDAEPFAVAETGPTGTVPPANLEGGIWVLFNKPVIALSAPAAPATSSPVLSVSPRMDGIYRWYGSRLLAFEPAASLAPATEYSFSVDPGLRCLDGEALTGQTGFSFRTEALDIADISPTGSDITPEESRQILVTFNFVVDLKTITPFLRLRAGSAEVPFRAARPPIESRAQLGPYESPDRFVLLTPGRDLPGDSDVTVRLLAGARPRPDSYGTEAEVTRTFHTLEPLSVQDSSAQMEAAGASVRIQLNHELKQDDIEKSVAVDVPGFSTVGKVEAYGSWIFLHAIPAKEGSTITVRLLRSLSDVYGQALSAEQALSLDVGPAEAYVYFRGTGQKVLEAQFPPKVAVQMQNVDAGHWIVASLPGPYAPRPKGPVHTYNARSVPRNARHFEIFDLAPYLTGGLGAAYLSWSYSGLFYGSDTPEEEKEDLTVQVTDIGASISMGYNSIVVTARSLSTGAPISGASVTFRKDARSLSSARTDAAGVAALVLRPGTLPGAFTDDQEKAEIEIARGKDKLVLRPSDMPGRTWNTEAPFGAEKPDPLTYIWSDRGIYRPGEVLSFAGMDRDLTLGRLQPAQGSYRVELVGGSDEGSPAASASGTTSQTGSFSGRFTIPANAEPGTWLLVYHRLRGKDDTRTGSVEVQVASFRRVTFAVDLRMPDARAFMGDTLTADFSGAYLAGGTIAKGKWSWFWTRRETWYQPPGDSLADYSFGDVQKGWPEDEGSDAGAIEPPGTVTAAQKLENGDKGRVYSYEVVATIEDIDRQAMSKSDSRLVFTSQQLLGAKITADARSNASLYLVSRGQPFALKVVSVDPDGKPLPASTVSGRLIREEWSLVREAAAGGYIGTHYEQKDVVEREFGLRTGAAPTAVTLSTQKAGSYAVELEGQDAKGRASYTRISFYSTGSDEIVWQRYDERLIDIVPDKHLYRPGDTAHLLIKSPVAKGTFVVTVEREGILERRTVDLAGSAPTIDVAITEAHVPIVYVAVATSTGRTAPPSSDPETPDFGKPRGYSGLVELSVETKSRTIDLTVTPGKDSYRPGSPATVTIRATRNGSPVAGAEIALVAADRGVLDLIGYHVPDPVDFFYARYNFPDRVSHFDSRDMLLDPVTWKTEGLPGGDEKGEAAAALPGGSVRKNFDATAVFRTGILTGKDGTASVTFTLPDSLTRYRATALAALGDAFGIAENELLVQNPINVRTALPRRMRVDDRATAGVVLTNLDAAAHAVAVTLSAQVLSIQGPSRRSVTLKPGETAEVAFDLAAPKAGSASLAFGIDSDVLKERLEAGLEVAAEHVNESFTIVGKTDGSAREALTLPPAFLGTPEEGLWLTLDSTIASSLAGAIRFLDIYPYDCLEQVTSKLFSRVLFPALAGGAADLEVIARFANPDSGFSYWDDTSPRRSNLYVSLRVAHLLGVARAKGIALPADVDTDALLDYIDGQWKDQGPYLQAYSVYVLTLWGRKEPQKLAALARQGDGIGVFGYGFLGLAYDAAGDARSAAAVLDRLRSFVRPGTRTLTLVGTVDDWMWYGGDLQAKALLLMLYARLQPSSQLALGLANDLLAESATGYWENTSNAGWVLQAFSEVIARGGEADANFTGTVKLGSTELARRSFKGLSKAPFVRQVAPKDLATAAGGVVGPVPLTFGLDGTGTLYYTAELRTSIAAGNVAPRDEGIGISADLLDERGQLVTGTALDLGKVYTMKVVFYSSKDRTNLALRAPLPSGADPIDGSLATSQVVRAPTGDQSGSDTGYEGDFGPAGYTTRVYDSEVRFFFDQLSRGKHEVTFSFRTTTPGVYPTPPAQAELMYQPEVFGRTAGTVYSIE